jgi:hypothetical protein
MQKITKRVSDLCYSSLPGSKFLQLKYNETRKKIKEIKTKVKK